MPFEEKRKYNQHYSYTLQTDINLYNAFAVSSSFVRQQAVALVGQLLHFAAATSPSAEGQLLPQSRLRSLQDLLTALKGDMSPLLNK